MFIHKNSHYIQKRCKKCITRFKLIFGGFCSVSRLVQSTQNLRVQTRWLIGRPSSGEPGWDDSSNPCIDSSSVFPWTIPPRVRKGRLTGWFIYGESYLRRLIQSLRRLIPHFSMNQFVAGPNWSTRRSTQPTPCCWNTNSCHAYTITMIHTLH